MMPVQGNIYMLVADGTNITVSVGPEGVMLVNTGAAPMSDKVLAAMNQLANVGGGGADAQQMLWRQIVPGTWGWSSPYMNTFINSPAPPKPIRYIINTSDAADHIGGNERDCDAGFFPRGGGFGSAVTNPGRAASMIAHENVLNRMSAPRAKGVCRRPQRCRQTHISMSFQAA